MKKLITVLFISFISVYAQSVKNSNIVKQDSDRDGIVDSLDRCPNTPDGVCVDAQGCIAKIKRKVYFDTGSYTLDTKSKKVVEDIIKIAKECFGYNIVLKGYTDSTATETFNDNLSQKRVVTIRRLLLNDGIKPERILIQWYGEKDPIASNLTKEGRAKNRRVEILFY